MEWEQGRTASAGGEDGQRAQRQKRDSGVDRRKGGQRDGWSGDGKEGKVQDKWETVGDHVRGRNEGRVGRGETRGKEEE